MSAREDLTLPSLAGAANWRLASGPSLQILTSSDEVYSQSDSTVLVGFDALMLKKAAAASCASDPRPT
jgi:hypothetical protein